MAAEILSRTFFKVYSNLTGKNEVIDQKLNANLEYVLYNYLVQTIAYKNSFLENMKEVEIAFENIMLNSGNFSGSLTSIIEDYGKSYISLIDSHPLTKIFIQSINDICSSKFNIKHVEDENTCLESINIAIRHIEKRLDIFRIARRDEETLPTMVINDIDVFEKTLEKYIQNIKDSDTFYNIFDREGFMYKTETEKIRMIIEGTMLNVSNSDAEDMTRFFQGYADYVSDNTFQNLRHPVYIGNSLNDELYVMAKRSELWYETPFYLSFMLKDRRLELPNVRLGISNINNKKVANIIATQTAQQMNTDKNYQNFSEDIKSLIPKNSTFRFINPAHIPSLVLTIGLLKGLGIDEVVVKDYMPFRYKKTIIDKQLSEEEAHNFQMRLTNKNVSTIMRLISSMEGLELQSYPESIYELRFKIKDEVKGKNEFLTNLYNIGYEAGLDAKVMERFHF